MTPATPASIAICFVLASPREETRRAYWQRRVRAWMREVPVLRDRVTPHWSPRRRLGYGAGLRACVNSLRRRHATLPPIIVLRPDGDEPTLADVDEVRRFDPAAYASIRPTNTYWGCEAYYKLQIFALHGYDRIVYLDCDTVALDDVSALWDPQQFADRDLYGVRETTEMGSRAPMVGKVNSGVMVVNGPLLSAAVHERMIDIARAGLSYDGGDQGVLHRYLDEHPHIRVGELDAAYNVMVAWKTRGRWDRIADRVRILHFVNAFKPWTAHHARDPLFDAEFKRLWDEAFRSPLAPIAERPAGLEANAARHPAGRQASEPVPRR